MSLLIELVLQTNFERPRFGLKKKNRKRINNGFWDQNRNLKYSIVLKQSISKTGFGPLLFLGL